MNSAARRYALDVRALPCKNCGCLKSNHGYWRRGRGYVSHPCVSHGCPVYVPPTEREHVTRRQP